MYKISTVRVLSETPSQLPFEVDFDFPRRQYFERIEELVSKLKSVRLHVQKLQFIFPNAPVR